VRAIHDEFGEHSQDIPSLARRERFQLVDRAGREGVGTLSSVFDGRVLFEQRE
jgi:hypothetical protein